MRKDRRDEADGCCSRTLLKSRLWNHGVLCVCVCVFVCVPLFFTKFDTTRKRPRVLFIYLFMYTLSGGFELGKNSAELHPVAQLTSDHNSWTAWVVATLSAVKYHQMNVRVIRLQKGARSLFTPVRGLFLV